MKVADSEAQFKELAPGKREEWFAESHEIAAAAKGLEPSLTQCIGFSVPLVLRSSPTSPNNPTLRICTNILPSLATSIGRLQTCQMERRCDL